MQLESYCKIYRINIFIVLLLLVRLQVTTKLNTHDIETIISIKVNIINLYSE